jgi:restriction system protein
MARKQKTSPLEDLAELTALLPWWAGVVLAIVSFFFLRWAGTPDPLTPVPVEKMGAFAVRAIWKTLAKSVKGSRLDFVFPVPPRTSYPQCR